MRLEFTGQIVEKSLKPSGNRVVACGQTDMKIIVAFRNFAKAPPPQKGSDSQLFYVFLSNVPST